jgi:hypothetical protein
MISTLYIFAVDFRNLLIHFHLRIAKVAFQAYLRDSQVNLNQHITKLDRKNVQSRDYNLFSFQNFSVCKIKEFLYHQCL